MTEAELFLAGKDPVTVPAKFYAVKNGRVPGIYTDWVSAQRQITGWSKPRHKCFTTRAEAQEFLDEGTQTLVEEEDTKGGHEDRHDAAVSQHDGSGLLQKKLKKSATTYSPANKDASLNTEIASIEPYEPGLGLPLDAEDGFDPNVIMQTNSGNVVFKTTTQREATKLQAVEPAIDSVLRVYTDGSSLRNGQAGAFAGVGVYFGPCDERQVIHTYRTKS